MPLDFRATFDDSAVSRAYRNMETGASKAVSGMTSTFSAMSVVSGALGFGFLAAGHSILEFAGNIQDSAEVTGLGIQAFQELSGVAEQGGVEMAKFSKGIGALNQSLQEALDGNDKTIKSFERLGISWQELNSLSVEELLNQIADGLNNSSNATESYAAASDLLGKGQQKFIGILMQGSEALAAQRKDITTMSDAGVKALDDLGDAFTRAGRTAKSWIGNLISEGQGFFRELADYTFNVPTDSMAELTGRIFGEPLKKPKAVAEDPRIKKQAAEDAKTEAEMMKEYNRLEEEAAKDAAKNAQAESAALERRGEMQRAFYIDGLEGEQKLKALEDDRTQLQMDLMEASDRERASLIEKLALKEQEIAKEKRLQSEKQRTEMLDDLRGQKRAQEAKLQGLQQKAIDFGLASPDERRQAVREQHREEREAARQKRLFEKGQKDARYGAQAIQNQIDLSADSIAALGKEIDKLILR